MTPHAAQIHRSILLLAIATLVTNAALMVLELISTPPETAAQVIAAEASGEGFIAMTAVGEVIRARGSFEGFSVMSKNLPGVFRSESARTRWCARAAWVLSKWRLFSGGATHFENVVRFGRPVWSQGMTRTAQWSGIEFYRKSKKWDVLLGKIKV